MDIVQILKMLFIGLRFNTMKKILGYALLTFICIVPHILCLYTMGFYVWLSGMSVLFVFVLILIFAIYLII